jgi:hypothetical protein
MVMLKNIQPRFASLPEDTIRIAVDRNIRKLRGAEDFIRREAGRREDNPPIQWHFSKARTQHIVDRVRDLKSAAGRGQPGQAGYAGGVPPGTAGGYPPGVTGGPRTYAPERLARYPGAPKNIYTVRVFDQNWRSTRVDVEATTQKKAFDIVRMQLPGYRAYQIEQCPRCPRSKVFR